MGKVLNPRIAIVYILLSVAVVCCSVFPAYAQSREDVGWSSVASCADLDEFTMRYPKTRFFLQAAARYNSMRCGFTVASQDVLNEIRGNTSFLLEKNTRSRIFRKKDSVVKLVRSDVIRLLLDKCEGSSCNARILAVDQGGVRFLIANEHGNDEQFLGGVWSFGSNSEVVVIDSGKKNEDGRNYTSFVGTGSFPYNRNILVTQERMEGRTNLWNLLNGSLIKWGRYQRPIQYSRDRKKSAATSVGASNYCTVYVYDEYFQESQRLNVDGRMDKHCWSEVGYFSADASFLTTLVQYSNDNRDLAPKSEIQVWNLMNSSRIFENGGEIAATDPSNSLVAVWDGGRGSIFQLKDRSVLFKLHGHRESVISMDWTSDGRYLATGSKDATVQVWDLRTGKRASLFGGFIGPVCHVKFSPDDRHLVAACIGMVRVYDAQNGSLIAEFVEGHGDIETVSYSPDGAAVVVARRVSTGWVEVAVWRMP